MNRKELNDAIIKMLKLRDATNKKKGGRKYIRLSTAAQTTLINGCAGKSFWQRFDAKHPDLTRRRVSHVSLKRVLACTKDMAISHLDSLAKELISVGIFTNAVRKGPGVWEGKNDTSRIYNHDETPQFVKYGEHGTAPDLFYCEKGKECKSLKIVNVSPFIRSFHLMDVSLYTMLFLRVNR